MAKLISAKGEIEKQKIYETDKSSESKSILYICTTVEGNRGQSAGDSASS